MNSIFRILLIFLLLAAAGFAAALDFAEIKKKAEAGNPKSQFALGLMYYGGTGVSRNFAEALNWYRLAADQGNAGAKTMLGLMYSNGDGVPKDYTEAVNWFRKAAEQGETLAQKNLGISYYFGEGVPKDLVLAHVWFNIAVAKGNEEAKKGLAMVEKEMTVSQKEKAMELARELFAKLPKGE